MKKIMYVNRLVRRHLAVSFFAVLLMFSACSEDDPVDLLSQQEANPYIQLGFYQSTDVYNDNPTPYRMLIKTQGDHEDEFIISNFADLETDVSAYWDGSGIVLPEQGITLDTYHRQLIVSGSVEPTDQGIKIRYQAREGKVWDTRVINATLVEE